MQTPGLGSSCCFSGGCFSSGLSCSCLGCFCSRSITSSLGSLSWCSRQTSTISGLGSLLGSGSVRTTDTVDT